MFKYYDALLNRSGDALAGYFVRLFDASGNQVTIYADAGGTAISTESGVANAAKSDENGMVRFFVENGTYTLRSYDASDTFQAAETGIPMYDAGILTGANVSTIEDTAYTLAATDRSKLINSTAATSVTITIPSGLVEDFYCSITQGGLGQVTIAAGDGVTLVNADGEFSTEARYVRLSLYATAADSYVLEGRTV